MMMSQLPRRETRWFPCIKLLRIQLLVKDKIIRVEEEPLILKKRARLFLKLRVENLS